MLWDEGENVSTERVHSIDKVPRQHVNNEAVGQKRLPVAVMT